MWGLLVLFAVGACGLKNDGLRAPPYVQSSTAFTDARRYLQQRVPHEPNDMTDPEARKHFAFGILAAVTGNIAHNYSDGGVNENWLNILDCTVPHAWMYYNLVSRVTNQLLSEANLKIQPINNLIDSLCTTTDSVKQCNTLVQDKISQSDVYIQNRARLLLALGEASDILASYEAELNNAVEDYTVVPYLLTTLNTQAYLGLIKALANVCDLLSKNNVPN